MIFGILICAVACASPEGDDDESGAADLSAGAAPSADETKACEKTTVGVDGTGVKVVHSSTYEEPITDPRFCHPFVQRCWASTWLVARPT